MNQPVSFSRPSDQRNTRMLIVHWMYWLSRHFQVDAQGRTSLKNLTLAQLTAWCEAMGEGGYKRALQVGIKGSCAWMC